MAWQPATGAVSRNVYKFSFIGGFLSVHVLFNHVAAVLSSSCTPRNHVEHVENDDWGDDESPDTTTTDDEDDHTDEENLKKNPAAAHAANVNDIAKDEPLDPDCQLKDGTTEAKTQDPNEQEEGNPRLRQRATRRARGRSRAMG